MDFLGKNYTCNFCGDPPFWCHIWIQHKILYIAINFIFTTTNFFLRPRMDEPCRGAILGPKRWPICSLTNFGLLLTFWDSLYTVGKANAYFVKNGLMNNEIWKKTGKIRDPGRNRTFLYNYIGPRPIERLRDNLSVSVMTLTQTFYNNTLPFSPLK